ncbi:hypothetical protein M422DRAFT_786310 [Sphaerobolus stellatus SS14]|uniref:F-box domain-containing protein n=1 Tax=Sphaerobolus stellatus (strain SS14) TaxID=990650 RepID=A0A0C9UBX4_SPHS4|nr:hypothetical protein M422DRAFT_786310 [Sphaerobolus stellatus SS14]
MTGRLPVELMSCVVDQLSPMHYAPTLAALTRTSREIRPIAEKRLYMSIYLPTARTVRLLLYTWNSRPELAKLVKQLYILLPDYAAQAYNGAIEDVLQRTSSNVTSVTLVPGSEAGGIPISRMLRGLQNGNGTLSVLLVPFGYDRYVKAFLESSAAQSLFRIELADVVYHPDNEVPTPITLNPDAAMKLTHIEAPAHALCAIVPGRPVTTVTMKTAPDKSPNLPTAVQLMSKLAQSTAPKGVVCLNLGDLTMFSRPETYTMDVIELAPRYLPNLWYLGTVNYPGFSGNLPPQRMYQALIGLRQLQILELAVMHAIPAVESGWESLTALVLRSYCNTLNQVAFNTRQGRRWWQWSSEANDFFMVPN